MFHPVKIISTANAIKLFEKCKLKENAYSRKIISMHKHLSKNLQVSLHCLEYIFPDFLPKVAVSLVSETMNLQAD